jgi:hypothetical protein
MLKRLALAAASILWAACAHACILTTGAGSCGNSGPHPITTPANVPLSGSYFNENLTNGSGVGAAVLRPNNAVSPGAFRFPSPTTKSMVMYIEGQVDPLLGSNVTSFESAWVSNGVGAALSLSNNGAGLPVFFASRNTSGQWWTSTGSNAISSPPTSVAGTGYASGYYPWTATGGNCQREPSGVWGSATGASLSRDFVTDPGFLCSSTPTVNVAAIPGNGAQQRVTPSSTSCVQNGSLMVITTSVPVAHGRTAGELFPLTGFTQTGGTSINTTFTVLPAASGTTLVGSATGTCPTAIVDTAGKAFSGTGGSITLPAIATTNPFAVGETGITTKNAQHFCAIVGENGSDSPFFPGSQFAHFVDRAGVPLPGSPALVPWLNEGFVGFTGSLTVAQPSLNVSAMNSSTITSATYVAASGTTPAKVSFVISSGAPQFVPGSEFTVSGMTPSGYNITYVADSATTQASTTIVGIPLSGVLGTPIVLSSLTAGGSGSLVGVIMPGMQVFGAAGIAVINAYGTNGSTGTGGSGTYQLATTQTAVASAGMFAFTPHYFSAASGGALTAKSQATLNDFWANLGATTINTTLRTGWGGSLANASMLWGNFPRATSADIANGEDPNSPSTSALASICKKTTDLQTFAAANGMTVQSLYRMNDPGIWADSGEWSGTGFITGSGTAGTFTPSTTRYGSAPTTGVIAGAGVPGCPLACPALTGGSTLTWASAIGANVGSSGSPVPLVAGAWKPAAPAVINAFNGYIDGDGVTTIPTLHVTSFPASGNASFTASLGNVIIGHIDNGTIGTVGKTLTVTAPAIPASDDGYAVVGVGTVITDPGTLTNPMTVTAVYPSINPDTGLQLTGSGWAGTYALSSATTQTLPASTNMFANGTLPAAATSLMLSGASTGTVLAGMLLTDGLTNITGQPIFIAGSGLSVGGATTFAVNPTYYPPFVNDALFGTQTTLIPGHYIATSNVPSPTNGLGINTPVSIIGYGSGFNMALGGVGPYLLSNAASNGVGSSGTPVPMLSTGIGDSGALAPGPALTIKDPGPGTVFPVTAASCTSFGNCTATGSIIKLSGTYDTAVLGGTPATIQGQVSLTPGGPPVAGCSVCAYTNLTGYTATLLSGTVWNWSGSLINIPPNGVPTTTPSIGLTNAPLFVSVRASNGQAYANMPSSIQVGIATEITGEGEVGALLGAQSGFVSAFYQGLWGLDGWTGANNNATFLTGPPVANGWLPAYTILRGGDRYGIVVGGTTNLSEGSNTYQQLLDNAFGGWTSTLLSATRDGIGSTPKTLGNWPQTQTIGLGNGTQTTWCSVGTYCPTSGTSGVSIAGPLYASFASATGAFIANGVITSGTPATLTIPAGNQTFNTPNTNGVFQGAVQPGMVLGVAGSPTLAYCTAGCTFAAYQGTFDVTPSSAQTWVLAGCTTSCPAAPALMRIEPATGAALIPNLNFQSQGLTQNGAASRTVQLIQPGTFQVSVNGAVVCQDSQTFAYTVVGGNCTGASIASSFVNYATGDYNITFTSPPTGPVIASWTNIMSVSGFTSPLTDRPLGYDTFGNGSPTSGSMSSIFALTPGGESYHIDGGDIADDSFLSAQGYPLGAPGMTQYRSWYFGDRYPTLIPGQSATTPVISIQTWIGRGVVDYNYTASGSSGPHAQVFGQWGIDYATPSTFPGSISGKTLTLSGAATGSMWEGEVIGCATTSGCPLTNTSGVYITGLLTGSWGVSGSTYSVVNPSSLTVTAGSMQNAVYSTGGAPAYYAGPVNDAPVQQSPGLGQTGYAPHMSNGPFGGRRIGARFAAQNWASLAGDPTLASDPILSRSTTLTACAGKPSPCMDYTNTYAAHATPTSVSGTKATFNGLSAHAIPIRVGTAVTCTGCSAGMTVLSVDHPPTQDTRAGQGQIGSLNNGFVVTMSATAPASVAYTFGCTPGSGGSNCVDFVFQAGTTKGTWGTPFALATCGENNLNGSAPDGAEPNGICQSNGVGSLVRTFRIGTTQIMWAGSGGTAGSPYDDGADASTNNAPFSQSGAFTCNIVDTAVVQCVKGNLYTSGVFTSVGKWASGSTFAEYGDSVLGTGRSASIMGYVGGQPFPFTAGTGGSSSTVTATGCATAGGSVLPKFDITTSGGSIIDAYPSSQSTTLSMGLNIGPGCIFTASGGTGVATPVYIPTEGQGGIATVGTDQEMMGNLLYDNSGIPGNPLNPFFTNRMGGYWEPGLPVQPFGGFLGAGVSG